MLLRLLLSYRDRIVFLFAFLGTAAMGQAQNPSPSPTVASGVLSLGATPNPNGDRNYVPPKVLTRQPVSYPELAHLNRVEGVVRVKFAVDESGHVESVYVDKSSSSVMLDQAVLDPRLKQWTFQPATLDGKPISSIAYQEFEFRLDPVEERAIAVKRLALPFGTPDPAYPPEAAAKGTKGRVTIAVFWQKDNGLVDKIYLIKSSGSGLLDRTALRFAYENWRCDPAKVTTERFVKTIEFPGS